MRNACEVRRAAPRAVSRAAAGWCVVLAVLLGGACAREAAKPAAAAAGALQADTASADLSHLRSNIPSALPDTFTPIAPKAPGITNIPDAPPALMDAAEREEGISRFCYQEYGQKVDAKLVGVVALVVTVEGNAVRSARVGSDDWSSAAGRGVNGCLVQKAPQAWKLLPGANVADGRYVVQLRFRPL